MVFEARYEGFGFSSPDQNFLPGPEDIYVSQSQIRRFKLQTGTQIGLCALPKRQNDIRCCASKASTVILPELSADLRQPYCDLPRRHHFDGR